MFELRIRLGRRNAPIFDLPAALGRQQSAKEIGDQIDALIAFLDDLGGDPDLEQDLSDFEIDDPVEDDDALEEDDHPGGGDEAEIEAGNWLEYEEYQPDAIWPVAQDEEDDGTDLRARHRDRIRETRCDRIIYKGEPAYCLRS